jgi:hypothetical protein
MGNAAAAGAKATLAEAFKIFERFFYDFYRAKIVVNLGELF